MRTDLEQVYDAVYEWAGANGFAGHDPFDGLESRFFRLSPFRFLAPARLAWLQMVKRSPYDLRPLLRVPGGINSKGIALFALGELARFRSARDPRHQENALDHLQTLRSLAIRGTTPMGETTASFGYNFDWQSRAFFAPKGTPTIVPTAFAARAFIESFELFGDESDLEFAAEICRFIVSDLQRPVETAETVCFSYTPGDESLIFNASLLAGETLAAVGAIKGDAEYLELAARSARYVIGHQQKNGAWAYGPKLRHAWVDNFHTAFLLLSLKRIDEAAEVAGTEEAIGRGLEFWIRELFLPDGVPKYYDSRTFPVDIHSAAAAIAVLPKFRVVDAGAMPLAEKVAEWTITNLRDPSGYFYYQKREHRVVRIPFIRWGQAWMAYALATLLEARGEG